MAEGVDLDRVTDEVDEVVGKAGERAAACAREMGRPGTGKFLDVSQSPREPAGESFGIPEAPQSRVMRGPADLADGFGVDPWFEERMSARHARRSV